MPYFATSDNCKLYYEEYGQGDPVVFVHGVTCNRHFFRYQIPEFAKHYRVLSFDNRGHGDSEKTPHSLTIARLAQDLKELTDYLGYENMTLIGWSMGAQIVFDYVRQFGCSKLKKFVWDDESAKPLVDDEWKLGLFGTFDAKANCDYITTMMEDWDAAATGFVPVCFGDDEKKGTPDWEWTEKAIKNNNPACAALLWLAFTVQDYRDMLDLVTVPALVTYGRKSCFSEETHLFVAKGLHAKTAVFPGGHIHHMEDYEAYNKAVLEFLAE